MLMLMPMPMFMPLNPAQSPQIYNMYLTSSPVNTHLHLLLPSPSLPSPPKHHIYNPPPFTHTSRIISMHSNRTSLPHDRLRIEESCAVDLWGGAALGGGGGGVRGEGWG